MLMAEETRTSTQADETSGVDRRTVLEMAAAGTVGTPALASIGSATTGRLNLRGITYDTLTHEFQAPASAKLKIDDDGELSGVLNTAGFPVDIGTRTPATPEAASPEQEYKVTKADDQFSRDGLPMKLRFVVSEGQITGTMTRPSGDYGRLGFVLVEPGTMGIDPSKVTERLKQPLMGGGKGIVPKGMDQKPDVPDTGIPQATGFRTVAKGDRNE